MDASYLGLIELLLVAGLVLGFSGWEVIKTRRELARNRQTATAEEKGSEPEETNDSRS